MFVEICRSLEEFDCALDALPGEIVPVEPALEVEVVRLHVGGGLLRELLFFVW